MRAHRFLVPVLTVALLGACGSGNTPDSNTPDADAASPPDREALADTRADRPGPDSSRPLLVIDDALDPELVEFTLGYLAELEERHGFDFCQDSLLKEGPELAFRDFGSPLGGLHGVSKEEWEVAVEEFCGLDPSDVDPRGAYSEFDHNRDGVVNCDDFTFPQFAETPYGAQVLEDHPELDPDGDGVFCDD